MKLNILSDRPKSTAEGSILAWLWRVVLTEQNLTGRVPQMTSLYLNKDLETSLQTKKKSKTSILADITSENMSWKVFLNLLFNVLRIRGFTLTITLEHSNKTETQHSVHVKNFKFRSEDKEK